MIFVLSVRCVFRIFTGKVEVSALNSLAAPMFHVPARSLAVDGWFVPDAIVQFVSHLPKSTEAAPVRPLTWLYS